MPEDHQNERPKENTPPKGDPDKSKGELNEGRPHPTDEPRHGHH